MREIELRISDISEGSEIALKKQLITKKKQ